MPERAGAVSLQSFDRLKEPCVYRSALRSADNAPPLSLLAGRAPLSGSSGLERDVHGLGWGLSVLKALGNNVKRQGLNARDRFVAVLAVAPCYRPGSSAGPTGHAMIVQAIVIAQSSDRESERSDDRDVSLVSLLETRASL